MAKTGPFSNGTVEHYQFVVDRIKQHPISRRKLKTVTPDHLQAFFDLLAFGGTCEALEKNRVHYELEHFDGSTEVPEGYTEIPLVCIRPDGSFESYDALSTACKMAGERVPGLEGFQRQSAKLLDNLAVGM